MKHTSAARRGGSSTGVIPIHHIHVCGGNGSGCGNTDNADDSIISSSSSSYWGRTTKRKKEEILQRHVVCVKNRCGPEGSREHKIHHDNATKVLLQTFGAEKHFVLKHLEGGSKSTKYINIQSKYVGN